MKDHCNVLLLALSTFPSDSVDSHRKEKFMRERRYVWENEKEYTGIYQLDPVPKMLADQLKQKGEYLDKIILLATKPTLEEGKDVEITYLDGRNGCYHGTELDYFKSQIERYMNPDIVPEERFVVVPIDEKNIEQGISDTIEKVREIENIKLYLDTHGGFRGIFLVAEAVISLLKVDKIEVQGIYGIEFSQQENKENRIVDGRSEFHIFDFVSGMNEFINYGRINSLEEFLKKNMDNDLKTGKQQEELILCIKKISEGIQLCSIAAFEEGLDELTKYYKEKGMQKKLGSHSYLFIFAENIKKDYGILLSSKRTVIDEIKWCRKKGFYQQVVTLIESRVPHYLKSVGLCDYHKKKGQDATKIFNQCVPWRYNNNGGQSPKERLDKMNGKWFPRQKKKCGKDKKYVDKERADIWMTFPVSEEKRALLDEFFQIHMELKDIRNQSNHALDTYNKGLTYVDKKITKYLEILEKLCK